MMNINDPNINPPVYARPLSERGTASQTGISLRDWLVGHALHALAAQPGAAPEITAVRAYAFADAVLAHRLDDTRRGTWPPEATPQPTAQPMDTTPPAIPVPSDPFPS